MSNFTCHRSHSPSPGPASQREAGTGPLRVQLKRTKGWKMPANSLKVDRTTIFGNPFTLDKYDPAKAVEMHRAWLTGAMSNEDIEKAYPPVVARHLVAKRAAVILGLPMLRGKNLGCWCSLPEEGQPDLCHAALLLTLANADDSGRK